MGKQPRYCSGSGDSTRCLGYECNEADACLDGVLPAEKPDEPGFVDADLAELWDSVQVDGAWVDYPPEDPGYYWAQHSDDDEPELVCVMNSFGRLVYEIHGVEDEVEPYEYLRWYSVPVACPVSPGS